MASHSSVEAATWLDGWSYRTQITLTGSTSGAITNYQIPLTLYSGSGTDNTSTTPAQIYLGGHSANWPNDIRFTDSDGSTALSYWSENSGGTSSDVWVKVPSVAASPSTVTFYVYYGNSSAQNGSDGANTFVFYDPATSDGSSSYTLRDLYNPGLNAAFSYDSVNQRYKINMTGDDGVMCEVSALPSGGAYSFHVSVESDSSPSGAVNMQWGICFRYSPAGVHYARETFFGAANNKQCRITKEATEPSRNGTDLVTVNHVNYPSANAWYRVSASAYASYITEWYEWENITIATTDTSYSAGTWGIFAAFDHNTNIYFKKVFVGNYIYPQPSVSSTGAEEVVTSNQPSSNSSLWWVWVVITLVVLSLGGIGLAYYWRKKNAQPKAPSKAPEGNLDEIKGMIRETEDVLRKAIDNAVDTQDLLWGTALRFLREDLSDISRRVDIRTIGHEEAKERILDLNKRVEKLRNPPPRPADNGGHEGERSVEMRAYGALGVDPNADGYEILGVSRGATKADVDRAFKQKQLGWHPDKFPSPSDKELANEVSKILNNAKDQIYKQRGWK